SHRKRSPGDAHRELVVTLELDITTHMKESDMESRENTYAKGFILGAVVGGAVGAVVALLFAPKSGRELRRDIADRGEELYDKAQKYFTKEEERADDMVNEGRIRAERIVTSARAQAESLLSNAEQVLRDAKGRAQQMKESVQAGAHKVADAAKAGAEAFKSEL
ncbi:MAG TPA: hypothetical protein DIS79_03225, partial [Bacteroidetes bacterium]|nr:hypothetical protein [Bacteroidota bacterium]